jgi:hypothetical protein
VRLLAWSKVETDKLKRDDSFGPSAELNVFAKQLLQLDRYERRALSRCRAAIREFDSTMQRR